MSELRLQTADWEERFEALQARKRAAAWNATIAPLVTERDDAGDDLAVIGNAWSRSMFGGLFHVSPPPSGDLPATNLVFVQSRDGNTVTPDPATLGGGEADTHLIYEGLTRVAADAVLGGGRTIRDGHLVLSVWRPELVALRAAMRLPRHPIQVAATLHGLPLETGLMFNVPELRVILITGTHGAAAMRDALRTRPWISLVVMDDPSDLRGAFAELRTLGIERMSCIGGRTLARPLLQEALVQDLYLTTGTKEGGEPGTPVSDKPLNGREVVRKHGTGEDEGVLFQHIVLSAPA
jgi:riboflavin biosynthesis pyrimidine reductase